MFKGSFVALVTPMELDGSVDYPSLDRLIEFHIENGTDGIVAVGTTGESATLSTAEYVAIVKHVVKAVDGRVQVIAGNGSNSTASAVELTKALSPLGLDGMLCVTPYYNKPSPKGLIAHFKAIADSTDVPQILYNVPGRTAVDMQPEVVAELAKLSNVVGIKEATGDVNRVEIIRELCGEDFAILSGDDATCREFMLLGGDGVISVVNNIAPKKFKNLCDLALAGNTDLSQQIDESFSGLYESLFIEANPIPVKWASYHLGLITNPTIRLPLTELSSSHHGLLIDAMKKAQIEVK
ncbi:4-hydroxy-tetrahydrodipicolinate synthase [Parashewanella tropica]|uniref:4-hydroxy-tetrahydrodipicolinate synthase n=1 Tax=Parashewanella tropica TaxID=2547970 RepID=UPI00105A8DA5|nr:4-hydroxy-tetrahydrodipicolinate synthase [Parashewanella tropica]